MKPEYEDILIAFNNLKEEISIQDMHLFERKEVWYLIVKVLDEDDHKLLNQEEILNLKTSSKENVQLTITKNTQIFIVAIKDVLTSLLLRKNVSAVEECINKYQLTKLIRKEKIDGKSTNVLIAHTNDEKMFIHMLKNGIDFKNKHYQTEPWIFKPMQCAKCGHIGHKAKDCKNDQTCLKCGKQA